MDTGTDTEASAPESEEEDTPAPSEEEAEEDAEPDAEEALDDLAEEGEEPEEEEEFFVARYKTKEAAEEALREKDETIQRLFRERDEERRQREEIEEAVQQPVAQQLDVAAWHEWAEEAVANGAGKDGAMLALNQGGIAGYDLYIGHWVRDEEQAAEAIAFNNEVQRELNDMRVRAALAPQVEERQQADARAEAEQARREVAARYEDFESLSDEMDRLAVSLPEDQRAVLYDQAISGVEGKKLVWEHLYLLASRERAPARARANAEEKKRRRASGDSAKVAATVSSSEGAAGRTPQLSEAERAVLDKRNALRKEWGLPQVEID
jgi:hypothetical protein